jgi:hypothetical protein
MTTKILGDQITAYTINTEQLSNTATAAFAKTLAPKILYANVASNTYSVLDDTAVNVGGGFIVVTGSEFQSGAQVLIDTVAASSVTYVNSNTLRAQVPARSAASYNLYVVNPDGGVGLKVAGITYSGTPTWVTASSLTNASSNSIFSGNFSATGATSYANTTILPTGFNLLANGYYFGNISVGAATTYSFDIRATDAENQDSDKTFSLSVVNAIEAEYLVVAGGGGAINSGGGGAGGLLVGSTSLVAGTNYTITVGSGGSAGASGSSSNIKQGGTTIVSTTGGGFGGSAGGAGQVGASGGSGGGAGHPGTLSPAIIAAGSATDYPGPTQQGYPGGTAIVQGGGGGGGAGSSGSPGTNPGITTPGGIGGNGGNGITWPYTGTTYAGGGGGFGYLTGVGTGGTGGGGNATPYGPGAPGSPGTNGLGGGAGAGGNEGSSGGSGVVILAIPTPLYPGSAPGATVTTPPAAPGKTIVTFNSSGTYTA